VFRSMTALPAAGWTTCHSWLFPPLHPLAWTSPAELLSRQWPHPLNLRRESRPSDRAGMRFSVRRCEAPEFSAPAGRRSGWALLVVDVVLDDAQRCAAAGAREGGRGPEHRPGAGPVDPAGVLRAQVAELTERLLRLAFLRPLARPDGVALRGTRTPRTPARGPPVAGACRR
jgi:hypothetical protein